MDNPLVIHFGQPVGHSMIDHHIASEVYHSLLQQCKDQDIWNNWTIEGQYRLYRSQFQPKIWEVHLDLIGEQTGDLYLHKESEIQLQKFNLPTPFDQALTYRMETEKQNSVSESLLVETSHPLMIEQVKRSTFSNRDISLIFENDDQIKLIIRNSDLRPEQILSTLIV